MQSSTMRPAVSEKSRAEMGFLSLNQRMLRSQAADIRMTEGRSLSRSQYGLLSTEHINRCDTTPTAFVSRSLSQLDARHLESLPSPFLPSLPFPPCNIKPP